MRVLERSPEAGEERDLLDACSAAALLVSATAEGARVEMLAVVAQSCMALMLALAVAAVGALWRRRRVDPGSS